MAGIAAWLAAIAWPLVSRVLVAMGIGTLAYTGASAALSSALTAAKAAFAGTAGPLLQLLTMCGLFDYASIVSGALVSGLAFMTLKKFALLTGSGSGS